MVQNIKTVYVAWSWNKEDKKKRQQMMNFMPSIWKRRIVPPQQGRSIDYYQDEEKNANIDDWPSVHWHYNSHLGNNDGEQDDNNI